ncbi:hypothetical protein QTP70_021018 [Hemibagrus guttatus]|uniref:Uncharacterized protein n=1 Tax=Hemibagrus guttatus TaxID=175788 RepID=A0AAE0QCG2_9TELE|nr:hypothetical protein QTP70_021018 [Hemibagrus guttatus]
MPPGRLPGEVFRACPTGKRPRGRPRTCWRDYAFRLAWERLGVPPEELEEVTGEREDAASLPSAEDGPNLTFFFFLVVAGTRSASLYIGGGDRRPHLPPSLPVGVFGPAGLRLSFISTTRQGTSLGAAARRWTSFGSAAWR